MKSSQRSRATSKPGGFRKGNPQAGMQKPLATKAEALTGGKGTLKLNRLKAVKRGR